MQTKRILTIGEAAPEFGLTSAGLTKSARVGNLGPAAAKDSKGRWLITMPDALAEYRARTDQTRARPDTLAKRAAAAIATEAPTVARRMSPIEHVIARQVDGEIKARLDDLQVRVLASEGFDAEDQADLTDVFNLARSVWAGCPAQPPTPVGERA